MRTFCSFMFSFCEKKKNQTVCDQYFMDHEVKYVSAIPGFDLENAHSSL